MDKIETYLDFVLMNIDKGKENSFGIRNILLKHHDFIHTPDEIGEEKDNFFRIVKQIKDLGYLTYKYFKPIESDHNWFALLEKGHVAIEYGGHFKYLETLKTNNVKEQERQDKQDEITQLDLLTKRFIYKARRIPYIVSGVALIISILSYFKPEKKQIDLQPMQQEILMLKLQTHKLDSSFQADSHSKKTTSNIDTSLSSGQNNE